MVFFYYLYPYYLFHCGCRGLLLHSITHNETHIRQDSPCMSDRPAADASIYTAHNQHMRQIPMPSEGFKTVIQAIEQSQNCALDRAAIMTGSTLVLFKIVLFCDNYLRQLINSI
jgi:hypothetical protein